LGFDLQAQSTRIGLYLLSILALIATYVICRMIVLSRLGKVLVAVRDAESRTRFIGYRVEHYKLFVWTVSAMMAGVAGALYVPQVGIINPGLLSPEVSIEIAVWVALGGRGALSGAVIGAAIISALKFWLTGFMPEAWPFILAGVVLVVVTLLPNGLLDLKFGGLFALRIKKERMS